MTIEDDRHRENQRRFEKMEDRMAKIEGEIVDVKLLLANQKGQWSTIKWLLGIGALLLSGNVLIELARALF